MVIHACNDASFDLYRRYKGRPFELPMRLLSNSIYCIAIAFVEPIYFLDLTKSFYDS